MTNAQCGNVPYFAQECFCGFCKSGLTCVANVCESPPDLGAEPDLAMATEDVFSSGQVNIVGYGYTINATHMSGFGASASFTTTTFFPGLSCVSSTVGSCQVQDCNGTLTNATQTSDNVGPFTFTVGGSGVFTFNPDNTNFYAASPSPRPSPSPGAIITVNFPGLAPVSVTEPDYVTLVSPSPAPSSALEISVEQDFIAYFSGGAANATATMTLTGQTTTHSVSLVCTSDASTGKVTATAAALQKFPLGSGQVTFQIAGQSAPVQFMGHSTVVKGSSVMVDQSGSQVGGFSTMYTHP